MDLCANHRSLPSWWQGSIVRPVGDWPVALITMRVCRLPAPRSCPDAHHSPTPILLPKPDLSTDLCTRCNGTPLRRGDVAGRGDFEPQVCQGQRDDRRLSETTETDVIGQGLPRQSSARAHGAKTTRHQRATCAPLFSSMRAAHRVHPSLVRRGLLRLGGVGG
jgi:hypothetical protein